MAEPATPTPPNPIELSISEARTRFVQLVRLTSLTRQTTLIVDHGRPIAALVSPDRLTRASPEPRALPGTPATAAGWAKRLEVVREGLQRQHATRLGELTAALDATWRILDSWRPPGSDRSHDALRAVHAELRRHQ
ncbi:type II toxin-antitoxin system Phd/YefM family antitoxin [Paractinoplanes rishiriensis]|uniref:Antitoxin n=1 Tax=Paractinoplanes rishiriensis TaxID=1050105 RepID=A0A919K619_9ACTN|nr:type II toxin-antitoxin system Phd/YefM family antitoxin [Actinoplanes rishiriensis]GIF01582.1 hypothetical protein Ari01nite_90460 [Actinoplanes rishiriensis]